MGRYEASATVDWSGFGGSVESASGMLATATAAQVELGGPGGATNPEELFAAAHANCFTSTITSMARSRGIELAHVVTEARVRLEWSDDAGDHRLAASDLAVRLDVAGGRARSADSRERRDRALPRLPGDPRQRRDAGHGLLRRPVSGVARAGAPVALIGAAVANLASVPIFVHAYAIASPLSVALLRLLGCAVVLVLLLPVMRRLVVMRAGPWWHPLVWALGVVGMNTTFYLAIDRIPLGIVVAVSFTGPIAVAAWHSRTRRHALGVGLVALGILALVHPGLAAIDPVGLALALANAVMWALYIVAVRRLTGAWSPLPALVAGTILGSLLLVPGAAATGGLPLAHIHEFAFLAAVGAIGAGLPYLVELFVMQRVTTRAFSVLQALYPAAGVAVGVIGLHQRLRPVELGGVVLVTCASALALESGGGDEADAALATALPEG